MEKSDLIVSHSARWESVSLRFPHRRQGAETSSHVLIFTRLCSILSDAFLALGVWAGCLEIPQTRCQGRPCSPNLFFPHRLCSGGRCGVFCDGPGEQFDREFTQWGGSDNFFEGHTLGVRIDVFRYA